MAETKRMHFVPRTYLKNFSIERSPNEFFISALAKKMTSSPFETNIKNICVEKNLYTLDGNSEEERQFIENLYNDLYEKNYGDLFKILTEENKVNVTPNERYSIIGFVVSMFYRNNSWSIGYNKFMDQTYEKVYHLSKENNNESFFFEEQEISIAGKSLEEIQKENRKKSNQYLAVIAVKKIFELIRLRYMNDVITIVKTLGNHEFITSDNPVTFRAENIKQRPLPIDPTNTLSIPIDKNHLLQLRPWGHELDKNMIGRLTEQSFISIITATINNQSQYLQSGKFLLGSKNSLMNFKPDPNGDNIRSHLRSL